MTFILLHNLQDNINMTVVLYPDYVIYQDSYCTEPRLTFSPGCIKISGSTSERPGTFSFEWEVGDLIDVECQWFQKVSPETLLLDVTNYYIYLVLNMYSLLYFIQVEFVMIKLRVVSKDATEDDSAPNTSGQCTFINKLFSFCWFLHSFSEIGAASVFWETSLS